MTKAELIQAIIGGRPWGEVAYWASQIGLFIVALVAAYFARKQVKAFATFELLKYIQAENLRDDREYVLLELDTDHSKWSKEEKRIASRVGSSYDVMGRVLQTGFADRAFFIKPAASSIYRTHQKLRPYIDQISSESGYPYWEHYRWLYRRSMRWYRPKKSN